MNILIIDNGSIHINKLVECLNKYEVKVLRYRKHTRIDLEWADKYILSGGNKPIIFKSYFAREIDLIISTQKPLIGICLGFELIADAFGSKLKRQSTKTVGVKTIEILPEYFGIEERKTFIVYEAHRWVLTSSEILETIGWSTRGSEIIKHPTRPIVGLQFHPEVKIPKNDGQELLNIIVKMLGQF